MLFCTERMVLIKDISNKKILIKVLNHLGFAKIKISLKLENVHFYMRNEIYNEDLKEFLNERLFIINDYNLESIDLDKSNIKKKPAKILYSFTNIYLENYNDEKFSEALNEFIGSSRDYNNPLLFDINAYLDDKKIKLDYYQKRKFMKFSDHFFSYYLNYYINDINLLYFDIVYITIGVLIDAILIFCSCYKICFISEEENKKKMTLIFMMIISLVNVIMIIFYKWLKFIKRNILRIDCIYSNNFDRIFIGLVKYSKTRYLNTFEYQMNNINKFIYEKIETNKSIHFHLKVIFKNNDFQQICTLENPVENEIEGLILLLNKKLIISTDNNLDSNEQI